MGYRVIGEGLSINDSETHFDGSDAVSKIDAAEKKSNANKDTVVFGMEDEDGGLVKVYVKSEQAEEFEQTLAAMLAGEDENEDYENTSMEIAEVLFKLKDRFEIVDVEWPNIVGDEEEEQEVADDNESTGLEDESITDGDELEDGDDDELEDGEGESEDDSAATSALQQVIDVMKADADAKKAESEAKTAEAKAKEAEYTSQSSASKVQQEEEVLDMEAYYKNKSDQEKEAKQLAKIAKYKHDKATDAETSLSMESIEVNDDDGDDDDDDNEITTTELAELILKNLRAN